MLPQTSVVCFLASYALALLVEAGRWRGLSARWRWVSLASLLAGLLAHTWYLLNRSAQTHLPPLLASTHDWMLVGGWLGGLIAIGVVWRNPRLPLALFILPVVVAFVATTYLVNQVPNTELYVAQARRGWGLLHAALLLLAMICSAAGVLCAVLYLLQHRRLKDHLATPLALPLPSLPRLALANRWAFGASFLLLTLGYSSGLWLSLTAPATGRTVALTEPVVVVSGLGWFVMAAGLGWLLRRQLPTGRQVAWLTITGLGCLLVALWGLQLATGDIHSGRRTATVAAPASGEIAR